MKIQRPTISDRASAGIYEDRSRSELETVLWDVFHDAQFKIAIVPDEVALTSGQLKKFVVETRFVLSLRNWNYLRNGIKFGR